MAIEVRDVNKSFGTTPVLTGINLDIASGSLTALLGPSGGGKSTLLRVIAGLEQPDTGTVTINGVDATRLSPQRRNVGFVFQHYAAFKHLTVFRNVAFGLEVRKRPKTEVRSRVRELLELVHLEQMADRYPAQLSGGQRQRMALARALAVEPEVLLLDEPFGALDAQVRKELRTWLRRLHDEVHVTTVFVTHDQEEAMDVSDEIVVLADGRVQQIGSPSAIYENPANPFVMGFLGPITVLNGQLVRPHDVDLSRTPVDGGVEAVVTRIVSLGFEIRIEARAGDADVWAQLTGATARALDVKPGDTLYFRPAADANSLTAAAA
jgi:sulfate transport system ATP-binding protein